MENLKREVFEETKIILKTNNIKIISVQDIFYGENKHVVRITFMQKGSGKVRLSKEHSEFQWIEKSKALKLKKLDPFLKKVLLTL